MLSSNQLPQQVMPTRDEFAGMTPEEQIFWRRVDERAEKIAEKKIASINPAINAGLTEIAAMKVNAFRQAHPDIKSGSFEEMEIAQKINAGYQPDDAYWSVMGPRGVQRAEDKAVKKVQHQITQKKVANVETGGVSPQVQNKPRLKFEEDLAARLEKL